MTKTTNYQLPQWAAADPIKRGDFNAAMAALDAGVRTAQETADGAQTAAGAAQNTAQTAYAAAQSAQSAADAAQAAADTAQASADAAQTTADGASAAAGTAQTTADSALALASADKLAFGSFIQANSAVTVSLTNGARLGLFWSPEAGTTMAAPDMPGRMYLGDWEYYCDITLTSGRIRTAPGSTGGAYQIYYAILY